MNANEQYVMSQVGPMLQPGEQVIHMSVMRRQPGLLMQMLLVGGLLLFLMTKTYWVVLTNRRMILIRSKVGMFSFTGTPDHKNLGVEEWDVRNIQKVTTSGFANNRSMTFIMAQGPKQTLRISPWMKAIPGTKAFLDQVPQLINSGQLQNQLGGAPMPQQIGQGMPQQQMQQGGYGAPPQQQGYGAPPPMQGQMQGAPGVLPPGTQVMVTGPDGNRYPATIVQEQQGQYLCNMQSGQNWVPAQFVMRA